MRIWYFWWTNRFTHRLWIVDMGSDSLLYIFCSHVCVRVLVFSYSSQHKFIFCFSLCEFFFTTFFYRRVTSIGLHIRFDRCKIGKGRKKRRILMWWLWFGIWFFFRFAYWAIAQWDSKWRKLPLCEILNQRFKSLRKYLLKNIQHFLVIEKSIRNKIFAHSWFAIMHGFGIKRGVTIFLINKKKPFVWNRVLSINNRNS